jgi:cyclohexanecarboxylate-CoA ligase/acyl-CoA synthetase
VDLLERWVAERPHQCFVSDGSAELDFETVRARAYRLGAALRRVGVRSGDRVALQLPNWAEFVVSYLALARIGAVMVPIMMVYRHAEVRHVLENSGAVAAITTGTFRRFDHAGMFRELAADSAVEQLIIARGQTQPEELSFAEACGETADSGPVPGDDVLGQPADPDSPHMIMYTSGTESTAKGCVHTWNTAEFSGRGLAHDVFHATTEDVMFMPSPVAHATGFVVGVLVPLTVGAQTHLMDVWEPSEGLRRIERYRCSATATATPFVRMALDAAKETQRDLSSMRFWLCAGAPIPEDLVHEFTGVFPNGRLMPLYGSTEILAGTCCHLEDPVERVAGSDGSPALSGVHIKLVDAEGTEVPLGEEGEICYWGPGAVLGYWRDPDRTAATIDGYGWHHTGDLGRADAEGYVRVTGRLKDIIIRGGTNISATEVEEHLAAHPSISQASVVAYPDQRLGEKACAFVVPADDSTLTLPPVTEFLRTQRRLANYKLPERLVVVDELPMTATGKVQKFQLREQARHAG